MGLGLRTVVDSPDLEVSLACHISARLHDKSIGDVHLGLLLRFLKRIAWRRSWARCRAPKRRTQEPRQKNEEGQHNSSGPFPLPSGSVSGRIGLDSRGLENHLTWEQSPEEPPDRRLAPWSAWKSTECKTRNMVDLRRARERVGLTQTELAAQLNVSQSMVSRYETNVGQAPFDLVVRWLSAC